MRVPAIDAEEPSEEPEPTDADGDADDGPHSILHGAGAGFREIRRSRDLTLLLGLYCAQTVVAGASLVFGVAIALDLLDLEEASVGLLDAVLGIGGLVGGFLALVLATRGRLAVDFGFGVLLWSAPLLLVVARPELGAVLLMMALLGLGNSLVDINAFTIMQRLVPDEVMGRVFGAVESALIAGMAARLARHAAAHQHGRPAHRPLRHRRERRGPRPPGHRPAPPDRHDRPRARGPRR